MKAVLIIDIPDISLEGWIVENLQINKYNTDVNSCAFGGFENGIEYYEGDINFIPMPEKISPLDVPGKYKNFGNAFSLAEGYNACIDEILGEGAEHE